MNTLITAPWSISTRLQIMKTKLGSIARIHLHKANFFSTSRSSVQRPPLFKTFYDYLKLIHTSVNESYANQKHPIWPRLLLEAFGNKHAVAKLNLDTVISGIDELHRKFNDLDEIDQLITEATSETDVKEKEELLVIVEDEKRGIETQIEQCDDDIMESLAEIMLGDQLSTSCILEVSCGVGGQEAMLFASDLFQMYESLCVNQRQDFEAIEYDRSDLGGIHKATAMIRFSDKGFHGVLQHESGIHRVQRIPVTDKSGRIHTSTASVALFPVTDSCVSMEEKDFEITTVKKSKGSGGQHANKTESGVRIKHLPTGLSVICNATRSQHENKDRALKIITAKLSQAETAAQDSEIVRIRKQQVKQRERSDKIRTYNFSQDRVTDHRIGTTINNITGVMAGNESLFNLMKMLEEKYNMNELIAIIETLLNEGKTFCNEA